MGSKRQKRNKRRPSSRPRRGRTRRRSGARACRSASCSIAVAAAYLKEDEVDISRITESRHCPRDKIKEFRHVPTFAVPPACPYVVRGFVGDGEWLGPASF